MVKLKTGIKELDLLIGGIESGSRNILYGPPGTGKTVFAMQFLWQGLQNGETVAFDVMDKPFPRLMAYFKSFNHDSSVTHSTVFSIILFLIKVLLCRLQRLRFA